MELDLTITDSMELVEQLQHFVTHPMHNGDAVAAAEELVEVLQAQKALMANTGNVIRFMH